MRPVLATDTACFVSPSGRAQQTARIALDGRVFGPMRDWPKPMRASGRACADDVFRDFPELAAPEMSIWSFAAAPG